jgi:hypothetical protein
MVSYKIYLVPRSSSSAEFVNDLKYYVSVATPPMAYAPGQPNLILTNLLNNVPWASPQNTQRVQHLAPLATGLGVGNIALSVVPASQTIVNIGTNISYTINVTTNTGFSGSVLLGVSGLPTNSAASFSPASLSGAGASKLGITTSNNTPVGNYTLTITGISGSQTNSTTVTLVVTGIGITWSTPANITGDADVAALETAVYAYDWANANTTVNGVNFTGTTSASGSGDGNVGITANTGTIADNTTAFTSSSSPFSGLSTAYQSILVGANYATPSGSNATFTVTLNNLVVGNTYLVQVWANDPRSSYYTRTEMASSANTVTLDYNYNQTTGGYPGQYTIGTFTASATSQTFTL